jgi:molybdopterin converting factor small subunit
LLVFLLGGGRELSLEVKLSFYGGCFEAVGLSEVAHPLAEVCTVEEFVEAVIESYPVLRRLQRIIVCARDEEYLEPDEEVRPGDHIQIMSALT